MSEIVPTSPVGVVARPEMSSRLAMDVAMGTDPDAICEAYDLQYHQLEELYRDPRFMVQVNKIRKDLEKEGVSFKLKAQMLAEMYLDKSFEIVNDVDTDPRVKADLIKSTVRWAGFDNSRGEESSGGGFTVHINLGNAEKGTTVEGELE